MKALIINLAHETRRMALQQAQMGMLGIEWERIEAITPATLTPGPGDPIWRLWDRPLRTAEMALLNSHRVAWQRVSELNEPCLVLEDDALLGKQTPAILHRVENAVGIDHMSLETRGRKKIVSRLKHPDLPVRRLYLDRSGAAAYILFPHGARILLEASKRVPALSDATIGATHTLQSWQADPALAIQLDRCAIYGVTQPIPVVSSIDAEPKPSAHTADRRTFRRRRIATQLRMGWRHLSCLPVATRRHIFPTSDWPEFPSNL